MRCKEKPFTFVLGVVILAAAAGLSGLVGCGGGDDDSTGTLRLALTDAAGPFEDVVIAVSEVRLVRAGDEGAATGPGLPVLVSYPTPVPFDITDLSFVQTLLGEARVPAGDYSQVRLVLAPNPATGDPLNYVTLTGDPLTKLPLDTPSGQQSGLKVIGDYEVVDGVVSAIALDFDPSRAIVEAGASGKYLIKPTGIRLVAMDTVLPTYGSISGSVLPDTAWASAVVSAIPEGQSAPIAAGAVNPDDGSFRLFVPAGSYAIRVTADGLTAYDTRSLVPPVHYAVVVGADTAAGVVTLVP